MGEEKKLWEPTPELWALHPQAKWIIVDPPMGKLHPLCPKTFVERPVFDDANGWWISDLYEDFIKIEGKVLLLSQDEWRVDNYRDAIWQRPAELTPTTQPPPPVSAENTAIIVRNMRADGQQSRADYLEAMQAEIDKALSLMTGIIPFMAGTAEPGYFASPHGSPSGNILVFLMKHRRFDENDNDLRLMAGRLIVEGTE